MDNEYLTTNDSSNIKKPMAALLLYSRDNAILEKYAQIDGDSKYGLFTVQRNDSFASNALLDELENKYGIDINPNNLVQIHYGEINSSADNIILKQHFTIYKLEHELSVDALSSLYTINSKISRFPMDKIDSVEFIDDCIKEMVKNNYRPKYK